MNIAIVADHVLYRVLKNTSDVVAYEYVYLNIFDAPFSPEKYRSTLRSYDDGYKTNNKNLLAIPVAINYCGKLGNKCYEQVIEVIDLDLLNKLYRIDKDSSIFYLN
jgi:hypothetical protein